MKLVFVLGILKSLREGVVIRQGAYPYDDKKGQR